MIAEIVRLIFVVGLALMAYQMANVLNLPLSEHPLYFGLILYIILGAAVGFLIGGWIGRKLSKIFDWIELKTREISVLHLILGMAGFVFGLIVATLIYFSFLKDLPYYLGQFLGILIYLILGSFGLRLFWHRKEEVSIPKVAGVKKKIKPTAVILDTSTIIDARIIEVVKTGFLAGQLLVPRFVLKELQNLADLEDKFKRDRGRQGLDALATLKKISAVEVRIVEEEYRQLLDVDAKLVELAKTLSLPIITTDFNLKKIAELQGVKVLNINDLALALRPIAVPGEEVIVRLVKKGKEAEQGVGYLEDGTMVVIEGGKSHIGEVVRGVVTSAFQTSAGRMFFAKLKED